MSDLKDMLDYVTGKDDSELAKVKAELSYALHCLERELGICHEQELEIEKLRSQLVNARAALEFVRDGYERGDINHVDYRVCAYRAALEALSKIDDSRNSEGKQ